MWIERVLVPIDGGALDARAFSASIDLARQLGASITGFIVEPFSAAKDEGGEATLRAHANGALAGFEQRAREAGVPFKGVATQSSAVTDAILEAAREHRCDMIVMATRNRGAISRMLWGSHTRDVMTRSELPVLVLH